MLSCFPAILSDDEDDNNEAAPPTEGVLPELSDDDSDEGIVDENRRQRPA